jgi:hypothetical protein
MTAYPAGARQPDLPSAGGPYCCSLYPESSNLFHL